MKNTLISTWNQVNFDLHFNTKSISKPRHKEPSHFRSGRQKEVILDRYTKTKSMPIHRTEMKSFSITHTTTDSVSS